MTNSKVYASTFKLSYLKLSSFFSVLQVAIARGPPKSADIGYKSTLKKIQFTENEYNIDYTPKLQSATLNQNHTPKLNSKTSFYFTNNFFKISSLAKEEEKWPANSSSSKILLIENICGRLL
ncbi:hypothetical protein P8452_71010 [Trifolium repens]|nr:hypothetical protein P8452_71010 [Trifolium repens]